MSDEDLKKRLESLLFSAGRKIELDELAKHCKEENIQTIKDSLEALKKELDDKKSPLMLLEEGTAWKLTVREQYLPYVKKVVKQSELPKSLLETLAVVAFKAPAMQSNIIKIRTNKAYKHLEELEKDGYITREKKGRSKLIKLTQKFFDYFDLPIEKLKEKFKNVAKLEKAIEEKEEHKTETYQTIERVEGKVEQPIEIIENKIGNLEVYERTPENAIEDLETYQAEEPKKHKKKKETPEEEQIPVEHSSTVHRKGETEPTILEEKPEWVPEEKKEEPVKEEPKKDRAPSKGIFPAGTPPDVEKKIDEIVKEMVEPKEEQKED